MTRKFIDVTTIVKNECVDVLSVNHADMERLMAVLQLAPVGSIVKININEEEIPTSPFPLPSSSENA